MSNNSLENDQTYIMIVTIPLSFTMADFTKVLYVCGQFKAKYKFELIKIRMIICIKICELKIQRDLDLDLDVKM